MSKVSVNQIKQKAESVKGQRLETLHRNAGFRVVAVESNGILYEPEISGMARIQPWNYIERMVERFNENGSLSPGDYSDIPTRNASYLLTLISMIKG